MHQTKGRSKRYEKRFLKRDYAGVLEILRKSTRMIRNSAERFIPESVSYVTYRKNIDTILECLLDDNLE
jgi:hypothetical protein